MKFSVLLPTRNRLELLKYAIETVIRQDYDDWEIIVSDNCSEEDVEGYIRSLNDARIKYYRTEKFVPVTENWNNALDKSTGDYVVMLGDDDCIMKGYFTKIRCMAEAHNNPDCIYTNALLYAYPGVMPDFPDGFLQPYGYASFFDSAKEPFLVAKEKALEMVKQSMNFKMLFTYNMQHSVISRKFIDSLKHKGPFFQSPYPDFYATNVTFLNAERILVCPEPLVTIGISPKSFGFYYANNREKEGIDFLKNQPEPEIFKRLQDIVLPGLTDRTSWLIAMETIRMNYPESGLQVNYDRYRYLQIVYTYGKYYNDRNLHLDTSASEARLAELKGLMRKQEKLVYGTFLTLAGNLSGLIPQGIRKKIVTNIMAAVNKTPQLDLKKSERKYKNILEVFEDTEPGKAKEESPNESP